MSDVVLPNRPLLAAEERLTAAHLRVEQEHRLQRLRRHLRLLHGWGVVCGLWVAPAGEEERPWAVVVCPGYAIGPYGDEILVPDAVAVDIRESTWKAPVLDPKQAYIAVRYAETTGGPMQRHSGGCACVDSAPQPRRILDSFVVDVLWEAPPAREIVPDLCRPSRLPCPLCEHGPHVALACIDLPQDEAPITSAHIHPFGCSREG